jgi:hypothetical protein
MKILLVRTELFHAGGQTDRYDEGNSRISQFAKEPRNYQECQHLVRTSYVSQLQVMSYNLYALPLLSTLNE